MNIFCWGLICSLLSTALYAIPPCMEKEFPQELVSAPVPWKNRLRRKALYNLDEVLHWSLRGNLRSFVLTSTVPLKVHQNTAQALRDFSHLHGYFSLFRPLVGKVSASLEDIDTACRTLRLIQEEVLEESLREVTTAEFLTKVLAYRDLQKGDLVSLKWEKDVTAQEYVVAKIFRLWGQMPAFGLIPKEKGTPILLFRGTDLSLDSQRGWASLMSDVDLAGPGYYAFKKAREEIHRWLVAVAGEQEKARVMGFSLGGALASYTFIFENEWISDKTSYAFNPPGISDKVIALFNEIDSQRQRYFQTFVNRGDVVSKVGKLFGNVSELSTTQELKPVSAHTALMTVHNTLLVHAVDVPQENKSR